MPALTPNQEREFVQINELTTALNNNHKKIFGDNLVAKIAAESNIADIAEAVNERSEKLNRFSSNQLVDQLRAHFSTWKNAVTSLVKNYNQTPHHHDLGNELNELRKRVAVFENILIEVNADTETKENMENITKILNSISKQLNLVETLANSWKTEMQRLGGIIVNASKTFSTSQPPSHQPQATPTQEVRNNVSYTS